MPRRKKLCVDCRAIMAEFLEDHAWYVRRGDFIEGDTLQIVCGNGDGRIEYKIGAPRTVSQFAANPPEDGHARP